MKRIISLLAIAWAYCLVLTAQVTIQNPVIYADVPDPDVICVGQDYYMVSTTAHVMPGAPIMHSRDMKNWEIIGYIFDRLNESPADNMEGGTIYSRGQWATSLRYHNGTFYAFFGTGGYSYLYSATDPAGSWTLIKRFNHYWHDASILFDDNGAVYLIHCNNAVIYVKRFTEDLTGFTDGDDNGTRIIGFGDGNLHEGVHAYKINGRYYMTTIWWPAGGNRTQLCFRANSITGNYEQRTMLSDDGGYARHGIAQGGIWQAANGEWYAMLFQDHEAVGRVPWLLPCRWVDGWPLLGDANGKAPVTFTINNIAEQPCTPIVDSDDFNGSLSRNWQWNHNPDDSRWSLTERPGWLRLKTGKVVSSIFDARNTLTQRTVAPACTGTVKMDISQMKAGDRAGLMAFSAEEGGLTVQQTATSRALVMTDRGVERARVTITSDILWLRMQCDFSSDDALFYYSTDGQNFQPLGTRFHMVYTLVHFTGYKFAIFNYATQAAGGYVDFDSFEYNHSETDRTAFILNPSFELGLDAWTANGFQSQGNNAFTLKQGTTYAERWVPRGQKVGSASLTQTLTGLEKGRYVLRFVAHNIQEDTPQVAQHGVTVFAEAQQTEITTAQQYELPFTAIENSSPIGIQADDATGNWIAVDHFQLEYLGLGDGSCITEEMNRRIAVARELSQQKMNQTTLTQLRNYLSRAEQATGNDIASAAAYLRIATAAAQKSASAYGRLAEMLSKAEEALSQDWAYGTDELQEAIELARIVYNQTNAANEALEQQSLRLEGALLALRLANGSGTPPTVTTDPRYARGNNRIFARMTSSGKGIIEEGFCYSTSGIPTIADGRATRWLDNAGRIYVIENLEPGTIYYIRAYAITNTDNIGYGDVVKAVTLPRANINWSYENNGPADVNDRINAGMRGWYEYWSQLTSIQGYNPHVRYADGTPTADCGYGGWCQVGPNANFQQQCMLTHEMLHGIGVGTHGIWRFGDGGMRGAGNRGVWLGERVTEVLTFWNNAYTMLDGDDTHMWPWGFNYSEEDPHTEAGYTINALVAQALGEDGLPASGTTPTAFYSFPNENGRKYYLTNEEVNHGLGTGFLAVAKSGSLEWRTIATNQAIENDSVAWYIDFNPATQLYSFRNAATGQYIVYDGAFRLQNASAAPASAYLQLMKGRVDATIRCNDATLVRRGYWIIRPENHYDSPCLAAIDGGRVRSEGFDLGNWAVTQRWVMLTGSELRQLTPEESEEHTILSALKVNNEAIPEFQDDRLHYNYEIDPASTLTRYSIGFTRASNFEGRVTTSRPQTIPGDGTATATADDGTETTYTIHFFRNHVIHWDGDGATGAGSEPSRHGWGPRYTSVWNTANSSNQNVYLDPYEGCHVGYLTEEGYKYNHRRILQLAFAGGEEEYFYQFSTLQPDSSYLLSVQLGMAEFVRLPKLTVSVREASTGNILAEENFTPSILAKTLNQATLQFRTPATGTTSTSYEIVISADKPNCTLTVAELIVTPVDDGTSTGLEDILTEGRDSGNWPIYTLSGILAGHTGENNNKAMKLPAGIYIIKGQKVIIK